MMAVWEVAPPTCVMRPFTWVRSSAAVSDGYKSSAATMTGSGSAESVRSGAPAQQRSSRALTSSRSDARSRISSFFDFANMSA